MKKELGVVGGVELSLIDGHLTAENQPDNGPASVVFMDIEHNRAMFVEDLSGKMAFNRLEPGQSLRMRGTTLKQVAVSVTHIGFCRETGGDCQSHSRTI